MKVSNEIINICPEIKKWRHELHAHPELGYEEGWTSNFVAEKLESFGLEVHRGMAKTGVVGSNHLHTGTIGRLSIRTGFDTNKKRISGRI